MEHMSVSYTNNPYNLKEENIQEVVALINDYIKKVSIIDINSLKLRDKLGYLGVMCELYPIINEKQKCFDTCKTLLIELKESIRKSEYYGISLYDGLTNLAFYVSVLSRLIGCCKSFKTTLDSIILDAADSKLKRLHQGNKISFFEYDTICGLAGVGNYLIDNIRDANCRSTLERIAEYFVYISCSIKVGQEFYPGWSELYHKKNDFNDGYIDFSLSHGIAGPLCILVRLADKNIIVPGQFDAIRRIIDVYRTISTKTGYYIWSGKIAKQKYHDEHIEVKYTRESWCYGNASVALIFLETAKLLDDSLLSATANDTLHEICQKDVDLLGLDSPILCHGYAGTAAIFRCLYDIYKSPDFLEQANKLLIKTIGCYVKNSKYGFPYIENNGNGKPAAAKYIEKFDFLEGSAGIIMELASWIKNESYFPKMLMIL